jgi:hypothetical protein
MSYIFIRQSQISFKKNKITISTWVEYNDWYPVSKVFEPRHDKTNIMGLRPAWIKTSLRIRAV